MEVEEEFQTQPPCKFSEVCNGRIDTTEVGQKGCNLTVTNLSQYPDDEDGKLIKRPNLHGRACGGVAAGGGNKLRDWYHSSRIIRVARASGGKDRHSKVWTSKGLRDRRVRLSVTTAIQFYDLQDRLGYDQPSKAIEWLIKAAADAITELPSLDLSFPDENPMQISDENGLSEGTEQGSGSFPLVFDHMIPVATTPSSGQSGDYNLNFAISSGLASFSRGTLQSNSSLMPHIQRFSSSPPVDGSTNVPFFIGAPTTAEPSLVMENHRRYNQFAPGLDLYGDVAGHSGQKGKGKNDHYLK